MSFKEFNEQIINPDGGNGAKDRSKTEIIQNIRAAQGYGRINYDKKDNKASEDKEKKPKL